MHMYVWIVYCVSIHSLILFQKGDLFMWIEFQGSKWYLWRCLRGIYWSFTLVKGMVYIWDCIAGIMRNRFSPPSSFDHQQKQNKNILQNSCSRVHTFTVKLLGCLELMELLLVLQKWLCLLLLYPFCGRLLNGLFWPFSGVLLLNGRGFGLLHVQCCIHLEHFSIVGKCDDLEAACQIQTNSHLQGSSHGYMEWQKAQDGVLTLECRHGAAICWRVTFTVERFADSSWGADPGYL